MRNVIARIKEKLRCIKWSDDFQVFPSLKSKQLENGEQFEDGLVKAKDFFKGEESPNIIKVIKASEVSTNGTTPD